jgi:hypothetical protein
VEDVYASHCCKASWWLKPGELDYLIAVIG